MSGVVVFDYSTWAIRFPELAASISQTLAQLYFNEACMYCDNTTISPIDDVAVRAMLLNLLVAHMSFINDPTKNTQLVGRVSKAQEGSVNVQTTIGQMPWSAEWFMQSKYGYQYWTATMQYRTALYFPGQPYVADPYAIFMGQL